MPDSAATQPYEIAATAPHFTTARSRRVTREMIAARTRELALRAGRIPPYVAQADYEQAKRELTGETDADRQDALINAAY
jgi:hypothetical protein